MNRVMFFTANPRRRATAALLHHPLRQAGHFPLAVIEARHRQRLAPIDSSPCRRLSRGDLLASSGFLQGHRRREGKRRTRPTEQRREPGFIEQQLLMGRVPEGADLLSLAPSRKGLLLYPQREEAFEVVGFGIRAARLPFRYRAPGDPQQISQTCLCQADGRAQREHGLTEGILSLTVPGGFLHRCSPFCVTRGS